MRPPMMVDSLVRWQLSTVPARVLAIDASTTPRPTSVTTTGIGLGRLNHHTATATARTTASAMALRRTRVTVFGVIAEGASGRRDTA